MDCVYEKELLERYKYKHLTRLMLNSLNWVFPPQNIDVQYDMRIGRQELLITSQILFVSLHFSQ